MVLLCAEVNGLQVVEQQRAACSGRDPPRPHLARVGICALDVPEELVERELRCDGAKTEGMKPRTATEVVDVFRKERLPCTTFTVQKDRRRRGRERMRPGNRLEHRWSQGNRLVRRRRRTAIRDELRSCHA
jgi:hypothetical protein